MNTRKLLNYVISKAEGLGWEHQTEGTGIYDDNGYEQHLWLSKGKYELEFYYYIKPKNNGYDYSITNTPLTRSELGDGCKIITHEYTTKEEIDEYFRAYGPTDKEIVDELFDLLGI